VIDVPVDPIVAATWNDSVPAVQKPGDDYHGHSVNEITVIVLCQELIAVKEILKELNISNEFCVVKTTEAPLSTISQGSCSRESPNV
jgi:hypothetical protein